MTTNSCGLIYLADDSPKAKAYRIKQARLLAGYKTAKAFSIEHTINLDTLKSWESAKNPLTEKGAKIIANSLYLEGLNCTIEWLLQGRGSPPTIWKPNLSQKIDLTSKANLLASIYIEQESNIIKEIEFFKSVNKNSIVILSNDDGMEPFYYIGDYVGGIPIDFQSMPYDLNFDCIILTADNLFLIRRVRRANNSSDLFDFTCTNFKTSCFPTMQKNVSLKLVAPILWQRKRLSSN